MELNSGSRPHDFVIGELNRTVWNAAPKFRKPQITGCEQIAVYHFSDIALLSPELQPTVKGMTKRLCYMPGYASSTIYTNLS
jgi:hypothetical protein